LVFAAIDGGARRVEEVHTAVARRSFAGVALAPGARDVAAVVRVAHDGIAAGVYATIRAVNAVVAGLTGAALDGVGRGTRPVPSVAADFAVGALNGAIGDRLERARSDLQVRMELRHRGRALAIDGESLRAAHPRPTGKLALFLHGLFGTEHTWRFYS